MVFPAVDRLEQGENLVLAAHWVASPEVPHRENATLACFPLLQILTEFYIGVLREVPLKVRISIYSGYLTFLLNASVSAIQKQLQAPAS